MVYNSSEQNFQFEYQRNLAFIFRINYTNYLLHLFFSCIVSIFFIRFKLWWTLKIWDDSFYKLTTGLLFTNCRQFLSSLDTLLTLKSPSCLLIYFFIILASFLKSLILSIILISDLAWFFFYYIDYSGSMRGLLNTTKIL